MDKSRLAACSLWLVLAAAPCAFAAPEAKGQREPGRFQLFFSPHPKRDVYLLDTAEGKVWIAVGDERELPAFERLDVQGDASFDADQNAKQKEAARQALQGKQERYVAAYMEQWTPLRSEFDAEKGLAFLAALKPEDDIPEAYMKMELIFRHLAAARETLADPETQYIAAFKSVMDKKMSPKARAQYAAAAARFDKEFPALTQE